MSHSAVAEETHRKTQIETLTKDLARLQQALAANTTPTQTAVQQYAKAECLALTHIVVTKLPRELRDMIYQHLSTRAFEQIEREHFRTTLDPLTRLYSYDQARWKASHFPSHFWDPAYVGAHFFSELVQNYYTTSTFVFGDDPDVLKRFLRKDELGLGLQPQDLVAHVQVHLNAVAFHRGSFRGYMFGQVRAPERLREVLGGLFDLKRGAKIGILFYSDAKVQSESEGQFEEAVPVLGEILERAEREGYRVRFLKDPAHEFCLEEGRIREWMALHG